MALQKQGVAVNFSQGVDTGTDVKQLPIGKFERLVNSVFDKLGRLTKRNGFGYIGSVGSVSSQLMTYRNSLMAVGSGLRSYISANSSWYGVQNFQSVEISNLQLINNSFTHSQVDMAKASNGLACVVYTEGQIENRYYYTVVDATTGQKLLQPQVLFSQTGTVSASPRVFSLANNFVVVFPAQTGSAVYSLQYFTISTANPTTVGSITTLSTTYLPSSNQNFDGAVANSSLYLSWNGTGGSGIKSAYITQYLSQSAAVTIASGSCNLISVAADNSTGTPTIWTSFLLGSTTGAVVATNQSLQTLFTAKTFNSSASATIVNMASTAQNDELTLFYESAYFYLYNLGNPANYISKIQSYRASGSFSTISTVARTLGLASKAFLIGSESYVFSSYSTPYQSSYFLVNSSGGVLSRYAYSNGTGYVTTGLPNVSTFGTTATVPYFRQTSITPLNKATNVSSTTPTTAIFAKAGISALTVNFSESGLAPIDAADNLNLNGGILWQYDGSTAVENNFFLYPDIVNVVSSGSGNLSAQTYYYQAIYEWTDSQGNISRSSPSVPTGVTVSSGTGRITVYVPTLQVTYKRGDYPPRVSLYRWSSSQQVYFSVSLPVVQDFNDNFLTFTDTKADSQIVGNEILYTTGGVLDNASPPALKSQTIFDSRIFGISAENQNLLCYTKTLVQTVPVEFSELLTMYIDPSLGAQGPTGPMECLAPMDDKLIIFKKNALYYFNGKGPDNTGANSQYSEPIFITSTVGCDNPDSIVLQPNGLMFQSDKGIWLLGRDLSTQYIGKPVEAYNSVEVTSAKAIPATNQVRFTLSNGIVLMYDYFVDQWGEFSGVNVIGSTLYNNLHTLVDNNGRIYQETPGVYLDGTRPVLMNWRTGWLNFAGLQGYQRVYEMFLLGQWYSPHRFTVGVAYDFDSSVSQRASIVPDNYSGTWGSGSSWGAVQTWGGSSSREQWDVCFEKQQCQSMQISFNEYYDRQYNVPAGAGLTISGLKFVAGLKSQYPRNLAPKYSKS